MDMWKFFNITHRDHILCNPMSLEKLEQLITLLPLKPGARVLDVAAVNMDANESPYITYYDDMAIHPQVGACCLPEGTCVETEEFDCLDAGHQLAGRVADSTRQERGT